MAQKNLNSDLEGFQELEMPSTSGTSPQASLPASSAADPQDQEGRNLELEDGFEHLQVEQNNPTAYRDRDRDKVRKPLLEFRNPLSSYVASFVNLFVTCSNRSEGYIRSACLECKLRPTYFRHLVWSLFLDLLPPNVLEWRVLVSSRREQFKRLKAAIMADKRSSNDLRPEVNNPLSQDEASPWNKYFADNLLKDEIDRDVVRTHSDHHLFEDLSSQDIMKNILFVFAKKYPALSYRQGMHEVLANLMIIQYDCCLEYWKCRKNTRVSSGNLGADQEILELLQVVNDRNHLEADIFFLFERFMEKMWDWYYVGDKNAKVIPNRRKRLGSLVMDTNQKPFQQQEDPFLCPAVKRLKNLWDGTLKSHDLELYQYLQDHHILPTTFGMNWTRLLFSRQFADFLVIWDAVIASNFTLIDFIVVAMVMAIRTLLLQSDATKCNLLLISKYPEEIDIKYIIAQSLYLKDSNKYPAPKRSPFRFGIPYLQEFSSKRKGNKEKKKSKAPASASAPTVSNGSNDVSTKRKFSFNLETPVVIGKPYDRDRKMVNLSGTVPETNIDDNFIFLEEESSHTVSVDKLTVWHNQLRKSLQNLNRSLSPKLRKESDVQSGLKGVEGVADKMMDAIKEAGSISDQCVEALEELN